MAQAVCARLAVCEDRRNADPMNEATLELRRLRREMKNTTQRMQRLRPTEAIPCLRVSNARRRVAVCLYQLQGGDLSLACAYIAQQLGSVGVPDGEEVQNAIVAWNEAAVANLPHEEFLAPTQPDNIRALAKAEAFAREAALVGWVREQNETKGLAPSARNAMAHFDLINDTQPLERAVADRPRSGASRHTWICRWARRWQISRGFFKPGVRLALEDRRAKVGIF